MLLTEVYLGLGSNLGDRQANIREAVRLLGAHAERITVSSMYETAPQGFRHQPPFVNAACRAWTALGPFQLMAKVTEIEKAVGRKPSFVNGPRTLDIDILFHGQSTLDRPELTIPHPRLAERGFVLVPLDEIAPDLVHPTLCETVHALLEGLSGSRGIIRKLSDA